jgi:hypothetical protein
VPSAAARNVASGTNAISGDVRFSAGSRQSRHRSELGGRSRLASARPRPRVTTAAVDPSELRCGGDEANADSRTQNLPRDTRRRFRSFGRGHALQRIDLYPVRAFTPSCHNRYSRVPKPEGADGGPNYYWATKSHQSSRSPTASPRAGIRKLAGSNGRCRAPPVRAAIKRNKTRLNWNRIGSELPLPLRERVGVRGAFQKAKRAPRKIFLWSDFIELRRQRGLP